MKRPLIIAHRGAPGVRWENTIAGFLAGIRRGAEWLELDLHQTADGAVIVHHDFTVGRKALARCTLEEARKLVRRRKRIELPTLDDVLAAVPTRVGLNLEIKAPGIAAAVVAVVARHRAIERVICSSFDLPTVRALADVRPRVRAGILTARAWRDPLRAIRRAHAHALFQQFRRARRPLVEKVQQAGFQYFVWTVNTERDLRRMLEWNVDGIITDAPQKLVRLRKTRRR